MKSKKWMVVAIAMLIMAFHYHAYNNFTRKQTRKRRIEPVEVQETKTDFYLLPGFMPVSFG
jgi:hypothetical protein